MNLGSSCSRVNLVHLCDEDEREVPKTRFCFLSNRTSTRTSKSLPNLKITRQQCGPSKSQSQEILSKCRNCGGTIHSKKFLKIQKAPTTNCIHNHACSTEEYIQEKMNFINSRDSVILVRSRLNPMHIERCPCFNTSNNAINVHPNMSDEELQHNRTIRFRDPPHTVINESVNNHRRNISIRNSKLKSCLKNSLKASERNKPEEKSVITTTSRGVRCTPTNVDLNLLQLQHLAKHTCFKNINNFRKKKPLLILDLNRTLCHFPNWPKLDTMAKRPFLHAFLSFAYRFYNIAIWSENNMKTILRKLSALDIIHNYDYEITICIDSTSCIKVDIPNCGRTKIKPLELIWRVHDQFNYTNTIIVDDQSKNFFLNQDHGLIVEQYDIKNYSTDQELKLLTNYLKSLLNKKGVFKAPNNHRNWRNSAN